MIRFQCTCGQKLKVAEQFAGKTAKCPGCHRSMVIPPSTPPDRPGEEPERSGRTAAERMRGDDGHASDNRSRDTSQQGTADPMTGGRHTAFHNLVGRLPDAGYLRQLFDVKSSHQGNSAYLLVIDILIVILWVSLMYPLWFYPVLHGIEAAKRAGISPKWMWFGLHPLFGWITYLVIHGKGSLDTAAPPIPATPGLLSTKSNDRVELQEQEMSCRVLAIPGYELKATVGTMAAGAFLGGGLLAPFAEAAVETAKMLWATPRTKGVTRNGTWLVALGQEVIVVTDSSDSDITRMSELEIRKRHPNASSIPKEELSRRASGGYRAPMWIVDLGDYGGNKLTLVERQALMSLFGHLGIAPPDGTRFDA